MKSVYSNQRSNATIYKAIRIERQSNTQTSKIHGFAKTLFFPRKRSPC